MMGCPLVVTSVDHLDREGHCGLMSIDLMVNSCVIIQPQQLVCFPKGQICCTIQHT